MKTTTASKTINAPLNICKHTTRKKEKKKRVLLHFLGAVKCLRLVFVILYIILRMQQSMQVSDIKGI